VTSRTPPDDPASTPNGSGAAARKKVAERLRQLRAASAGWNFVTAPLVGGAMGYGLDWLFGTYPWLMLVGMAFGFVAAFIEVLRSAR